MRSTPSCPSARRVRPADDPASPRRASLPRVDPRADRPLARGPDARRSACRCAGVGLPAPVEGRDRWVRRPQPGPDRGRRTDRTGSRRRGSRSDRSPSGSACYSSRSSISPCEFSVVVGRDLAGRAVPFPLAANRHDLGILVESIAPAPPPVTGAVADEAMEVAVRIAMELDMVGTLTVELFLLRDGSIAVNELAPRVHNSGHWTIEGAAHQPVRAAHPGDLRAATRIPDSARTHRDGQPPGHRPASRRPTGRRRGRPRRPARPPPRLRQATRVRASEDGPRHGRSAPRRRRGAVACAKAGPLRGCGWAIGSTATCCGGQRGRQRADPRWPTCARSSRSLGGTAMAATWSRRTRLTAQRPSSAAATDDLAGPRRVRLTEPRRGPPMRPDVRDRLRGARFASTVGR